MRHIQQKRPSFLRGFLLGAALLMVGSIAMPTIATAATIYTLTEDGSSGGFGTGPYGTVTVTELNATDLRIVLDVTPNYSITRGNHHALTFTLSSSTASIVIDNSSPANDFVSLGNGTYTNPPWGGFNYAIDCSKTNGNPTTVGNCGQTLTFDVLNAGSLLANGGGDGIFFAADIYALATGKTGSAGAFVGDVIDPDPIPLPAAAWLFGSALLGLVAVSRRTARVVRAR